MRKIMQEINKREMMYRQNQGCFRRFINSMTFFSVDATEVLLNNEMKKELDAKY